MKSILTQYLPFALPIIGIALLLLSVVLSARTRAIRYRLIKGGLILIFLAPILRAVFNLLDPAEALALTERAAEASVSGVGSRAWYTTQIFSVAVNILFGLFFLLVADAFKRPGRGLGKCWALVSELSEALSKYARVKAGVPCAKTYMQGEGDAATGLSTATN